MKLLSIHAMLTIALSFSVAQSRREGHEIQIGRDPDAVIRQMYDVLSGPAGDHDWAAFASLFHEKAIMGASARDGQGKVTYRSETPADYMRRTEEFFRTQAFYVEEIHRVTERFGEIAQVFSSYRFRAESGGLVPQNGRGINSIQLIQSAGRWWIISIQFTNERQDLALPKQYGGSGYSPRPKARAKATGLLYPPIHSCEVRVL